MTCSDDTRRFIRDSFFDEMRRLSRQIRNRWWCANCERFVELATNGTCSGCGSQAVSPV